MATVRANRAVRRTRRIRALGCAMRIARELAADEERHAHGTGQREDQDRHEDERTAEADEYREKISRAELPEEVAEKALEEADRLEMEREQKYVMDQLGIARE